MCDVDDGDGSFGTKKFISTYDCVAVVIWLENCGYFGINVVGGMIFCEDIIEGVSLGSNMWVRVIGDPVFRRVWWFDSDCDLELSLQVTLTLPYFLVESVVGGGEELFVELVSSFLHVDLVVALVM